MLDWIVQMLPFVLLIVFWLFMLKRGRWVKLPERQIELLEMQLAVLRQTSELLKKLSAAR